MKKKSLQWLSVFVMTALLAVAVFFLFPGEKNGQSSSIKVGMAIALTGYAASFGESEANAVNLLRDKFPNVEFYIEDTKSDPKNGLLAARKLIDMSEVDLVYCDLTTIANAIVSTTNESEKLLIASVYLTSLLERSPYAIRNLPRGIDESMLLVSYLSDNYPNTRNVAVLGSNDEFGNSSIQDFRKVASEENMNISFEDMIPENQQQINSLAAKISSQSPDAVYMASLMPSLGLMIKELRLSGYKGHIVTTDAFAYPYIRSAAGTYAKGVIYVDFPSTEASKELSDIYRKRFNQELTPTVVLAYDGLSLALNAHLQHPNATIPEIVQQIDGSEYDGIYGRLSVKNREIIYPLVVKVAD